MMLLLKLLKENRIKVKLTLLPIFLVFMSVNAQDKPDWINSKPVGAKYSYYVGAGKGNSIQESFESALNTARNTISSKEDTVFIHDKSTIQKLSNIVKKDGEIIDNSFNQNIVDELSVEISKVIVGARFVDFFYDSKESTCWVLIAKARFRNDNNEDCLTYNKAPIVWRSAVIPGWGQFYKKKTGRGIALLTSETLLITSAVYCENMRLDNMRKSSETLNITVIKEYRKRADDWELRRNISIAGAIGVYALNILDATLGKGEIKYAFIPGNIEFLAYKEGDINQFGLQIKF